MLNFHLNKNCEKKVLICFFLSRMESTEKCEAIIQHFNGKFIKIPPGVPGACQTLCWSWNCRRCCRNLCVSVLIAAFSLSLPLPRVTPPVPTEPLLCKFADGGQKKRQNQGKYLQNGRPWARDPDTVSESFFKTPNMNFLPRILAGDQNRKHVSKAAQFFPPLLLVGWLFFFICVTFGQAAVSVCMTSQVLNPVHCFPREEWRLRMTPQPYKMGEWYADTGWKQPYRWG